MAPFAPFAPGSPNAAASAAMLTRPFFNPLPAAGSYTGTCIVWVGVNGVC
jgi:hypothetical protein